MIKMPKLIKEICSSESPNDYKSHVHECGDNMVVASVYCSFWGQMVHDCGSYIGGLVFSARLGPNLATAPLKQYSRPYNTRK